MGNDHLNPDFPIESTLKLVPYDLTRVCPVVQNVTKIAIWMSLFVIYTCVSASNVCYGGLFNTIFGILFMQIYCIFLFLNLSVRNYFVYEIWCYFLGILTSWQITKLLGIVQFSYNLKSKI